MELCCTRTRATPSTHMVKASAVVNTTDHDDGDHVLRGDAVPRADRLPESERQKQECVEQRT